MTCVYLYPVITLPPLSNGAVNVQLIVFSKVVSVIFDGGPGGLFNDITDTLSSSTTVRIAGAFVVSTMYISLDPLKTVGIFANVNVIVSEVAVNGDPILFASVIEVWYNVYVRP